MKKIIKITFTLSILLFSFFYTNKIVEIVREKDNIMKEIRKSKDKYEIKYINAKINNNKIIPGKNGRKIDYDETYKRMKQYGIYNEVLTTFKETKPSISINNIYNKYINHGNLDNKNISLVFKIRNDLYFKELLSILNNKDINCTMFIDSLFLKNNISIINKLNYQIELLNEKDSISFKSHIDYLNNILKKEAKFCYLESENDKVLDVCSRLKLHTVIPNIIVKNNPYKTVSNNLINSSIISFEVDNRTIKELPLIIDYIKQKGYSFNTLSDLISENN